MHFLLILCTQLYTTQTSTRNIYLQKYEKWMWTVIQLFWTIWHLSNVVINCRTSHIVRINHINCKFTLFYFVNTIQFISRLSTTYIRIQCNVYTIHCCMNWARIIFIVIRQLFCWFFFIFYSSWVVMIKLYVYDSAQPAWYRYFAFSIAITIIYKYKAQKSM